MEDLNLYYIEKLWSKNIRPVSLYVHNPFCKINNCSYCVHCGYANPTDELVDKYYFEYFPKLLDMYKNIINTQNIVFMNFGGGTPNYLNAKKFDKFLSQFPKKLLSLNKIIELHPAYLTKDFLDVLKKYNFTTLVFCIQTFDVATLVNQKRAYKSFDEIKELWNYARSLGFNLGTDFITLWDFSQNNWNILDNDLRLLKELEPDEISISPLYQNKYTLDSEDNITDLYRNIGREVRKYFKNYENPDRTLSGNYNVATVRLYKPNSKIINDYDVYTKSLTDNAWNIEMGYSTLGMGQYWSKYKPVYSIIGPEFTIYEEFNNWDTPKFHLAKNYNFWDSMINWINKSREKLGENIPVGENVIFTNVCSNENLFYDKFKQGECETRFMPRATFDPMSDFEFKLSKEFNSKAEELTKNK